MAVSARQALRQREAAERVSLGWCKALGGAGQPLQPRAGSWADRHAARMAARESAS